MTPLIDLFENYYVTEEGKVFSREREETFFSLRHNKPQTRKRKHKEIKQFISNSGYCQVNLYYKGNLKRVLVHRLVAESFIKNDSHYLEVNHKDGNKLNNNVSNLEWSSRTLNALHSTRVLKKNVGDTSGTAKLCSSEVLEICDLLDYGTPQTDIAKRYGVTNSCIFRIDKGLNWNHLTKRRKEGINDTAY